MNAEKLVMQRRIDTLDQYATLLYAALTEAERENARLKAELETVKRERDAAVHDINYATKCESCKHYPDDVNDFPCNECIVIHHGCVIGWEWRGLCKENGGIHDV